ncbi:MAG: TIGR03087 family PEP-CTERM/XrtA system glycosyltransferase [Spongiibacteraceae bacterium]
MNILFLSHRVPYPPNKGEKIRTFNQIKYLADLGHRITVLSPVEGDEDINNLQALKQLHGVAIEYATKPGKLALVKGLLSNQALSVVNFYTKALQKILEERLSSQAFDAVVCSSSSMAEYVFNAGQLQPAGAPTPTLVMDFMDLDSDKWRQYQRLNSWPMSFIYAREARLVAQYEQKIHQHFDAGLFISQAEVDLFLSNNKDLGKLHVIGNGMDTEFFKPCEQPKPSKGPVMLFTGVMDYLPNEDAVCWFVEGAWQQIKSKHPDAEFIIAGMNPSAKVKALAGYQGVIVTGFVEDIREHYDRAHLFVAPFRLARGVQNKVLQAFACGLPTITTTMGCEGIAADDQEHVMIADSMEATLQAIDTLVANPALYQHISANALQLVQSQFSWQGKLGNFVSILTPNNNPITSEPH